MIVGIDPGLATCGVAVLDDDAQLQDVAVWTSSKRKAKGDIQRRVAGVVDFVLGYVKASDAVVLEWPAGGSNRRGSAVMLSRTFAAAGAIFGAVWVCCISATGLKQVLTPAPVTWRSALGARKADDAKIHARIERTYGVTARLGKTKAPHACDAIGLALYGLRMQAKEAA